MTSQTIDSIHTQNLQDVEIRANSKNTIPYLSTTPVQTLGQQQFLERGLQSLSDAVRQFNGVVLKDYGGIGGIKAVSVRGMGSEHTAVAYDDILVSNVQSGQIDIGRFSLDNIEYISLNISQGDNLLQSARAFGFASVLNFETITPEFDKHNYKGHAKIVGGAFGLFNPMVNYSQKISNKFLASANVNWQRSDGNYPFIHQVGSTAEKRKRNNSDTDIFRTELNLYNNFGKRGGDLKSKIYYYDSERGLPGAVINYNDYAAERLWDRNFFAQTSYSNDLGSKVKIKSQAKYSNIYTRYRNDEATGITIDRYREQEIYTSNVMEYTFSEKVSASIAQDLFYNTLKTEFTHFNEGQPLPKRYNSMSAMATRYKDQRLTICANLSETYIYEKKKNVDENNIYRKLSPSISISYAPFEQYNWRIRVSYQQGYRVPSFNELYYTSTKKQLNPELSKQINIGSTWIKEFISSPINYINLSVDLFNNRINDKIIIIPRPFIPLTTNLGEVDIKGAELKLTTNLNLTQNVRLNIIGGYSYMSALDKTDKSKDSYNNQLPYIPKHMGNVLINIENPIVKFSYSINIYSRRYTSVKNQEWKDRRLDGYSEHSVSLYKDISLNNNILYIQAGLTNIWNTTYEIIKSYPMPRRSYQVTVGYKF